MQRRLTSIRDTPNFRQSRPAIPVNLRCISTPGGTHSGCRFSFRMSYSPFTCRADVASDMKVRLRHRSLCAGPAVDLVLLDMYPDGGAAGLPKGLAPERLHEAIAQLREPPGVWSARELAERLGSSRVTPVATSSTSSRSAWWCVPCGTAAAGVPRWSTGASTPRGR
jgi:hypothetical protein